MTHHKPPGAASDSPDLTINLRADPRFLAGVRELIAAVARRLGLDEPSAGRVALATDEALCNVIEHGYKGFPAPGPVTLDVWPLEPAGIAVVIEDSGNQTDPALIKPRPLDEVRPGGLGVHIIREVMDQATYATRESGTGMRLTMIKHAPSPDNPADPRVPTARGTVHPNQPNEHDR